MAINPIQQARDLIKKRGQGILNNIAPTPVAGMAAKKVAQSGYFDPSSNNGNNFWSTGVAKGFANVQQKLETKTLPKVNLQQYAQKVEAPIPRVVASIGTGVAQDLINLPQRLLEGGARAGVDIRNNKAGQRPTLSRIVGTVAGVADPLIDIATLGGGTLVKGLGKEALESGAKQTIKQVVKRGAIKGAVEGGIMGGVKGLAQEEEAKWGNFLSGLLGGAAIGGTLGAGASAIGFLSRMTKRAPEVEAQLRDKMGRYMAGEKPVKPDLMPKPQWDFQVAFNQKYKRNPYTPVFPDDLKRAAAFEGSQRVGFQARDINLDKNPLGTKPESVVPTTAQPKSTIGKIDNPQDPYFNVNRYNIDTDSKLGLKKVVEEAKPQIEKVVGKKLSNTEAVMLANKSSETLHKVVSRNETLQWEAKLLKARQQLAQSAKDGVVDKAYLENLKMIKSQATDIARKLQSFSIDADPKSGSTKNVILDSVLKVEDDTDKILKAAENVDFNDANQAATFYRQFIKPSAREWLDTLRYNSMLSSPNTHINNAFSNFVNTAVVAPIEKTLTGTLDFLGGLTGKQRKYFAGEGVNYAKGYWGSVGDAGKNFLNVLSGKMEKTNLDTKDIPLATTGIKGGIFKTLDYPMKLLEASDQFFSTLVRSGEEAALKYRQSKGVNVGDIADLANKDAAYRTFRQDLRPDGQGTVLNSIDDFTGLIMKARGSENPITSTIAKFTLPFVKTPMNIFKQGLEYSPLGISTLPGASNKTQQLSKAILGSGVFTAAATLVTSGRSTWGEPKDQKSKNAFRAAGMQPYSIKIGDKWVSYQKLPPAIAFPFAMTAALNDAKENGKITDSTLDSVLTAISKYGDFLADQSYLKNIGDTLSNIRGDVEAKSRLVSNYPQQIVPFRALSGWIARLTDPTQRQVNYDAGFIEQQVQQLMLNIPGLSQQLEPRMDSSGNPIPNNNRVINSVSPVKVSTQNEKQRFVFDYGTTAVRAYKNLQKLPREEAAKTYDQIVKFKPELAREIKKLISDEQMGLTGKDIKIRNMGVADGSRAQAVARELKSAQTKEEKAAIWDKYVKAGIITKDVKKQLIERGDL